MEENQIDGFLKNIKANKQTSGYYANGLVISQQDEQARNAETSLQLGPPLNHDEGEFTFNAEGQILNSAELRSFEAEQRELKRSNPNDATFGLYGSATEFKKKNLLSSQPETSRQPEEEKPAAETKLEVFTFNLKMTDFGNMQSSKKPAKNNSDPEEDIFLQSTDDPLKKSIPSNSQQPDSSPLKPVSGKIQMARNFGSWDGLDNPEFSFEAESGTPKKNKPADLPEARFSSMSKNSAEAGRLQPTTNAFSGTRSPTDVPPKQSASPERKQETTKAGSPKNNSAQETTTNPKPQTLLQPAKSIDLFTPMLPDDTQLPKSGQEGTEEEQMVESVIINCEENQKLFDPVETKNREEIREMFLKFKQMKKKYELYIIGERSVEASTFTENQKQDQLCNFAGSELFCSLRGTDGGKEDQQDHDRDLYIQRIDFENSFNNRLDFMNNPDFTKSHQQTLSNNPYLEEETSAKSGKNNNSTERESLVIIPRQSEPIVDIEGRKIIGFLKSGDSVKPVIGIESNGNVAFGSVGLHDSTKDQILGYQGVASSPLKISRVNELLSNAIVFANQDRSEIRRSAFLESQTVTNNSGLLRNNSCGNESKVFPKKSDAVIQRFTLEDKLNDSPVHSARDMSERPSDLVIREIARDSKSNTPLKEPQLFEAASQPNPEESLDEAKQKLLSKIQELTKINIELKSSLLKSGGSSQRASLTPTSKLEKPKLVNIGSDKYDFEDEGEFEQRESSKLALSQGQSDSSKLLDSDKFESSKPKQPEPVRRVVQRTPKIDTAAFETPKIDVVDRRDIKKSQFEGVEKSDNNLKVIAGISNLFESSGFSGSQTDSFALGAADSPEQDSIIHQKHLFNMSKKQRPNQDNIGEENGYSIEAKRRGSQPLFLNSVSSKDTAGADGYALFERSSGHAISKTKITSDSLRNRSVYPGDNSGFLRSNMSPSSQPNQFSPNRRLDNSLNTRSEVIPSLNLTKIEHATKPNPFVAYSQSEKKSACSERPNLRLKNYIIVEYQRTPEDSPRAHSEKPKKDYASVSRLKDHQDQKKPQTAFEHPKLVSGRSPNLNKYAPLRINETAASPKETLQRRKTEGSPKKPLENFRKFLPKESETKDPGLTSVVQSQKLAKFQAENDLLSICSQAKKISESSKRTAINPQLKKTDPDYHTKLIASIIESRKKKKIEVDFQQLQPMNSLPSTTSKNPTSRFSESNQTFFTKRTNIYH